MHLATMHGFSFTQGVNERGQRFSGNNRAVADNVLHSTQSLKHAHKVFFAHPVCTVDPVVRY
jgi:hypothetical protein